MGYIIPGALNVSPMLETTRVQQRPTCGQVAYITRAVLGVPKTSKEGLQ